MRNKAAKLLCKTYYARITFIITVLLKCICEVVMSSRFQYDYTIINLLGMENVRLHFH